MSLHTLAHHMSTHGRGPDSTLVHMSPREIQGLQSLAQAHGRSLTVNPQTGLPEAGILEDILPSIAGFAMDAFAPGSGTVLGGIASLMGGESSSEPARSNPMGLASTSLERGLQAGFGTDIYEPSSKQMSEKESPAGSFGAIQSAINTAPPKDYLQENKYNMYSEPQRYDSGGMTIGNVGAPVDASGNPIVIDPYDTRTDSQKAQDYLLGKPRAVNPFLFYHKAPSIEELAAKAKAAADAAADAKAKAGISALTPEFIPHGGSGLSAEQQAERDDPNAWANIGDEAQAEYYADHPTFGSIVQGAQNLFGYTPIGAAQEKNMPKFVSDKKLIAQGINPNTGAHALTSEQKSAAREAIANPVAAPGSEAIKNMAAQYAMYNNPNAVGGGGGGGRRDAGGNDGSGATNSRESGGWGSRDAGAEGGFLNNGRFDQRYAYGGGITALAQGGYNLGSYSDGGRLLRGPGDGVSDDIPATIGQNQPARLADGEFVVPARIVSELGNGSTEAGARKLYAMMDRVQKARSKTVGKNKVAANSRTDKYLPI